MTLTKDKHIYRQRVRNSPYYYGEKNLCKTKREWEAIDPEAEFIDCDDLWTPPKREADDPLNNPLLDNNLFINTLSQSRVSKPKRDNFGTTSGQDLEKNWGIYSKRFDEILSEAAGRMDKREVADILGTSVTGSTFRKLLARRTSEGKVRAWRGSHYLIEWINRDYKVTALNETKAQSMLNISLPLGIDKYAALPPRSIIGIPGMTSSGKTSFLLEMAELNVVSQDLPVYYWYNEMSEAKLKYRCEDFPALIQAQGEGKFFPVMQTNFEFADVLQPDAINLFDYIDRDDNLFLIGEDIKGLYRNLNSGVAVYALQKKAHLTLGYGGGMSIKLSNLYITLDEDFQSGNSMHGKARIRKCKDWKRIDTNPVGLWCKYYTGGKHGKLFLDGEWQQKERE